MHKYPILIKILLGSILIISLFNRCQPEEPVVVNFDTVVTTDSTTGETIVRFENNSQGGIAYKWDFGDGKVSNLFLPRDTIFNFRDSSNIVLDSAHVYRQSGTFSITLTVVGNDQTQSLTKSVLIMGSQADFEADTTRFDVDNSVTFRLDDGAKQINGAEYNWDFGDGKQEIRLDTNAVPHTYANGGIYVVQLTTTQRNSEFVRRASKVITLPALDVSFTAEPQADNPKIVKFTPVLKNAANITGLSWDMGDNNIRDDVTDFLHPYISGGTYLVKLTVTQGEDVKTITQSVTIPALTVDFNFALDKDNKKIVTFTPQIENGSTNDEYTWNFGDNIVLPPSNNSAVQRHRYANGGTFTVTLTVKQGSDERSVTKSVNVPALGIDFVANFNDPNKKIVTFTPSIQNGTNDDKFNWEFGDGKAAQARTNDNSFTYTYANGGTFNVQLSVTQGSDVKVVTKSITIPALTADFEVQFNNTDKKIVTFVPNVENGISTDEYTWEYGDNVIEKKNNANTFTHTYPNGGNFNIKLTVKQGDDVKTVTRSITVPSLIIDFETQFNDPTNKKKVTFVPNITNGGINDEFTWDFGDNTSTQNKTNDNAFIYSYASGGSYGVTLSVKQGNDVKNITKFINIPSPNPDFTFSLATDNFYDVTFTNVSSNADGATYAWAFGDGDASTDTSPNHRYATGGIYNVTLTMTVGGEETNVTKNISIPNLLPDFDFVINGFEVVFDASSSRNTLTGATYSWDFRDGSTGSGERPTRLYSKGGVYDVVLTIDQGTGLESKTVSKQVVIAQVVPDFTVSIPNNCPSPCPVSFTNTSRDVPTGATYAWSFGDGMGNSTLENPPTYHYNSGGTYTVTLVITVNGNNFTEQKSIIVPSITASFNVIGGGCEAPCSITLQNTSSNVPSGYSYFWEYGTGGTLTHNSFIPSHPTPSYANSGNYTIKLTIRDGTGNDVLSAFRSVTINTPNTNQPINLFQNLNAFYTFNNTLQNVVGSNTVIARAGHLSYAIDRKGTNNSALDFSGNDAYLDTDVGFPAITNGLSISFWIKSDFSGTRVIFDNGKLSIRHNGIILQIRDGGFSSSYTIKTSFAWSHFVVIFRSGGNVEVYQNGSLEGITGSWSGMVGTGDVIIGGDDSNTDFNGLLDDIRIYSRAINQSEVAALYNE